MDPCKECGASLPEEARFCHQCGTPVVSQTTPEPLELKTPMRPAPHAPPPQLEFVQPALAGGMFLGLLSAIPFVNAGNCLCCMWVLGGGGLAALLLTKQRHAGITYGDGAFVGVLSGLFGAVVATAISIPVRIISARFFEGQQQTLEETLRQLGVEGPMRDLMIRVASPEISVTTIAFTFFTNLLMFALFAMIGGILTVAILERRQKGAGGSAPPAPFIGS